MPSDNSGGRGMYCIRASLIVFNAVALLAGLATIGIGLWLVFQEEPQGSDNAHEMVMAAAGTSNKYLLATGDLKVISVLLLSIGALVSFVSVIGCTGACVKSRCLLMSYLLTVVLILTLQLLAAVCVFLYREPIAAGLHDELMADLKNEAEMIPESAVKRNWDVMQHHIQCCGVDRYSDWYKINAWPGKNYVPDSCCVVSNVTTNIEGCGRNENPSTWYKQGCLEKIKIAILEQLHVLASIVITLVFLQLYGIIASILVFFHSKTPKPKSPQYKAYLYERARM